MEIHAFTNNIHLGWWGMKYSSWAIRKVESGGNGEGMGRAGKKGKGGKGKGGKDKGKKDMGGSC